MISCRDGSTISLAAFSQYCSASASAAAGSTASKAANCCSRVIGTSSVPNLVLTFSASQAGAVPAARPTTRMREWRMRAGTRSRATMRSMSAKSRDAARITRLPAFCHCGTYIQSWPLKGCEKIAVGRPASTSLSSGCPLPNARWTSSRASAPASFGTISPAAASVFGINSPPVNSTSPSRCCRPSR